MECQRCFEGHEARYRVYTDNLNIKVCASCAEEARELGIPVKILDVRKKTEGNPLPAQSSKG